MKAEIKKILEMNKNGAITDDQAAELIEEIRPEGKSKPGLASMVHETIHMAMEHAKEHHHHHRGHHHRWHHSHVREPRGTAYEFDGNEINMSAVSDLHFKNAKMNANKIDACKLKDFSFIDAAFTDSRMSASAVSDVHISNSEVRASGFLCSKIDDLAITERSVFENVEINAFIIKDTKFTETSLRDVVIYGGDVGWFKKSCFKDTQFIGCAFKKVIFKGCQFNDVVIKNLNVENMTIEGLTLSDCVIDGTEEFLKLVKNL